ncbi:MAG: hypothetical protein ACHQ52_06380 [Candidatus Eisenbacteria bacterium]
MLALWSGARADAGSVVPDPACATWPVVQRADVVLYPLPHPFLRAGTDSVSTALRGFVRGHDYVLDPARGVLRLLRAPVPGETLWVSACFLLSAPPVERQHSSYRPARAVVDSARTDSSAGGATLRPRPITARVPAEAPAGTSLALSGNKTIAVEFGSAQDPSLKQSLDLAVSGTLAPGVELTGVLSDRNVALTPGGATAGVQAIDRLLLQVRSPQGMAELGDVTLKLDQGEFAHVDRRLQGVDADWHTGGFTGQVAAASAQGQYRRIEFFGIEGQQGPYTLTGADGGSGISVVTGSEQVTLDGERMTRGETADYSVDYDRGQITFTNRRAITSASRIAVEYQYTLDAYHRNLALVSGGWKSGPWWLGTSWINEGDDRGRPITGSLDASDQLALAAAGDSAGRAIGPGVTAGTGDYVLVQSPGGPYYTYAGPDSGNYAVTFAVLGPGRGDYAESTLVAGRTVFRHTGAGLGDAVIGRLLPLPESHQLFALRGGANAGLLTVKVDGSVSRLDQNTASNLDDGDNGGHALDASARLGGMPGAGDSRAGIEAHARDVDSRFSPFGRLEAPYTEESWGLAPGSDIDHQRREELSGFVRDRVAGELRGYAGELSTPDGYRAFRRSLAWSRVGPLNASASWDRADGTQSGRGRPDGGRQLVLASLRWTTRWLEPALRATSDERWVPSDSVRAGARTREVAGEVASPGAMPWHAVLGLGWRRDGTAAEAGFTDQTESRTTKIDFESPAGGKWGGGVHATRRDQVTLEGGARTRTDLASLLLRASEPRRGLSGQYGLEITSEGQTPRSQTLAFVGPGRGAYDSLGRFVGTGNYDLVLVNGTTLTRVARAATSVRAAWNFGAGDTWRGSRVEVLFESDARRRGDLRLSDLALSPGVALGDTALARGTVLQRLESELAPGSPLASVRLRLERRLSADRSYSDFDQTLDDRTGSLLWRARAGGPWSSQAEGRLHVQSASQSIAGTATTDTRTLDEAGLIAQIAYSTGVRLRVAISADLLAQRPRDGFGTSDGLTERTLHVGPDVGLGVGARGRLDVGAHRGFESGPVLPPLVPSIDPLGPTRWDANARFDYRLFDVATVGMTLLYQDRPDRPTQLDGRAEVRAFF